MSEHFARARSLLGISEGIVRNAAGWSPESTEVIAEAQAHATLALVEQQKIANKLAAAHIAQLGELTRVSAPEGYPRDPALPADLILTPEEEAEMGL